MMNKLILTSLLLGCTAATTIDTDTMTTPITAPPAQSRAYLHSYNLPGHGVAIEGFSPVSYFDGKVERGAALFAVEHNGITYYLTGEDQVSKFRRTPERFVPAYGGWCAFGMSVSDKFPIDPAAYKIVNDKLLLFLNNSGVNALDLWNQGEQRGLLEKADAHWRKVQG